MLKSLLAVLCLLPALALAGYEEAIETYRNGDYDSALVQFRALAGEGDKRAMFYIGYCYRSGYGVKVDHAEAGRWFHMASVRGDSRSQYYLGKMLEAGQGVTKDLVAAHLWLSLSARFAPDERDAAYTQREIRKLERRMTPEQIAEAKQKAADWQPEK
jgi:TPR repeat protein